MESSNPEVAEVYSGENTALETPQNPENCHDSPTNAPSSSQQEPGSQPPNNTIKQEEEPKQPRKATGGTKRTSAEVLQRRKEGRLKAAATIAYNLKKTGIGRFESENGFGLTSVKTIQLINQKNYYADYLKKDEQVSFIRNGRAERLMLQKLANMKKSGHKEDSIAAEEKVRSLDLADIEVELSKKKNVDDNDDDDDDDEEIEDLTEEKAKQGYDTIVIHPGSSNIRIGRATDAFPRTVPTVIAIPTVGEQKHAPKAPERAANDEGEVLFGEDFDTIKATVTKDFKARMRFYKRRMLPNSREAAANFNKKQQPEIIPDHNDPFKKEWLDINDPEFRSRAFFVGDDALKLPIGDKFPNWKFRYPIVKGNFNESPDDYQSPHEVLGDLYHILLHLLAQMDLQKKDLAGLKAILIIPDFYDKTYVEAWTNLLFKTVGFGKVGVIQEAVAATFGAGATTACVVDIGAQTTSVACVDDGMIIDDSRIFLNYGGDNVTETFTKLLLQQLFPYKDINLNSRVDDWELAQTLKHNFVTFQDADIAVQLYNFYKRRPFESTEKYDFKVFDEAMLAPLGLFYPEIFQIPPKEAHHTLFTDSVDQYNGKPDNPYSKAQENVLQGSHYSDMVEEDLLTRVVEEKVIAKASNPYARPLPPTLVTADNARHLSQTPLEKAIIDSITAAGIATDFGKIKKLYDNLLIVGGGFAKIAGHDLILSDRINIWRPKHLSSNSLDEIVEYATKQRARSEAERKKLVLEYKTRRHEAGDAAAKVEDIELLEEEVLEIESLTKTEIDWDHVEALSEKGGSMTVNVLPPPREFDPEMITWKGGSVYGRLKVVNEMWISDKDWDVLETRSLYYKSLFNY